MNISVLNLSTGTEYMYSVPQGYDKITCLINAYLIETGRSLQIGNERMIEQLREKVIYGQKSAGIGDLGIVL